MHRIRRHRSLLRSALLVLVALGMLLQPVLGALAELHAVEHAVAMQSGHGHSHHDGHDVPADEEDLAGDPIGSHTLLHEGGIVTSMALLQPAFRLLPKSLVAHRPARAHVPAPTLARLTLPFRPPIA